MSTTEHPKARRDGLVLRELPQEILIYDTETHEAHCLNETAAFVWQQCDGTRTVPEIVATACSRFDAALDEEVVWVALEDLWRRQLLEGEPAPARERSMSRSQVLKRAAVVAAVSVPVVTSIVAPTAAHAASLVPCNSPCDPITPNCQAPCTCVQNTQGGGGVCL